MKIFEKTHEWLDKANLLPVDVNIIREWINEELDEFEDALKNRDKEGMYDAVIDINVFLANLSYFYKLDVKRLGEYADAVNKSNWTKFCTTEQEVNDTISSYLNGTHPNKLGEKVDTYCSTSDGIYVIKRVSDNKILKSINFKDTSEFLDF